MIDKIRGAALAALVLAGVAAGCGEGGREVRLEGPTAQEREAQLNRLTPQQRQLIESMGAAAPPAAGSQP